MEHQVIMEWKPTLYEYNQKEIITPWPLQYESAVIHQGVFLKFVIFKNLPKIAIFGFMGRAKFSFIIKMWFSEVC